MTMSAERQRPKPGDTVKLVAIPPGLLGGLPESDQQAIASIVGRPVALVAYDDDGRAELEFIDSEGTYHSIWVHPRFIQPA